MKLKKEKKKRKRKMEREEEKRIKKVKHIRCSVKIPSRSIVRPVKYNTRSRNVVHVAFMCEYSNPVEF